MTEIVNFTSHNIHKSHNINSTQYRGVLERTVFQWRIYTYYIFWICDYRFYVHRANKYTIKWGSLCWFFIFRHYSVILREFVFRTLLSYINMSMQPLVI